MLTLLMSALFALAVVTVALVPLVDFLCLWHELQALVHHLAARGVYERYRRQRRKQQARRN